jgi:hypothetical protein
VGSSADGIGSQPGDEEVVQFGRPARQRSRWAGSLLLACLVAAAVVLVVVRSGSHREATPVPLVTVTDVGHPILGVRAGWELFGLDHRGLVMVQFARGRIVSTTVPPLLSEGPVFLVAARGEAIIRPLDNVRGYVVPDGAPARPLAGVLAHGGYLLPGPTPAQQWLDSRDLDLVLVGPGGKREHADLPQPALLWATQAPVISDGRGGVILTAASGTVYDANNGALRTISAFLLAVGPRNWLGLSCDEGGCRNVVISAATGVSRTLPGAASYANPWPWQAMPGVTSPDGAAAAVIVTGNSDGQAWLDLISLSTGAVVRVPVPVAQDSSGQSLAWSPDSRWLFAVTAHGTLAIIDKHTGQLQRLSLGLARLSQIVIRPAGG